MNLGEVILLVMMGGILVALGVFLGVVLMPEVARKMAPPRGGTLADLLGMEPNHVSLADPESEEEEPAALPLDPDNPPVPRVYHRRPGSQPRYCHCHNRELQDGETILFWPNPEVSGAVWLVCQTDEMRV